MIYIFIWIYLVIQRLIELKLAKSNEKYQLAHGGIKVHDPYYKWFIIVHVGFLFFILFESFYFHRLESDVFLIYFILFLILQLLRLWVIGSLGRAWNTKIIVNPNETRVKSGIYKWISHPNYWIVLAELIVIPLLFHAYYTAILFSLLHLILLTKRIPMENHALKALKDP
ncbi:isoprenylcysteine carboxyl methyltransferase family protein [Halalkalibacillus halophilus]|uniref:isoprenylcysteine carboxyl methyltransferase family protein n=1 Tax=Halalkalibacillus halophilus TaxID=392827 RepID=UPI0004008052|nr:isoprenylcysteine carboxylmethyltransferase family protein [Halalkalibacillus halophilus]